MKKLTKALGIGVTAMAAGLMLTACGGGSSSSSKEIVFWNPFTGADKSNLAAMIDAYNKTNPDYKVKNVSIKEVDMYAKIPTVVNSGKNIPDVNIVHAERLKQYSDSGMLEAIDDELKGFDDIKAENYVPAAWNVGEIDGTRVSLPLDIHNWGTYYNKELVEKYAPTILDDGVITYDELREASTKAKPDGVTVLGTTWVKPNYMGLLKQEGGTLSEDGTNPSVNSKQSQAALQVMADMVKEKVATQDGEDPTQLFLAGKLMFFPEGIWIQNNIKSAKFEWGLTNTPQLSDDKSKIVNWASSHQFVMFKSKDRDEAKQEAVMEFIDWIRTNSQEWAKAGQNPASLAILEDSAYTEMPQSFFLSTEEEQKTLNIFDYKYNGYVSDYLEGHGFDAVNGKTSVAKMTEAMQKEVEDKIAKDKTK
jgi:multiple sugar transport system substrate-binding protein